MKSISDYDSYLKLIDNTCEYENLLSIKKTLDVLVDRDKSNLTNFQAIVEQLDGLLKYDILKLIGVEFSKDDDQKTVAQAKKEAEIQQEVSETKHAYYSIVKDWDNIIADAKIINQLLVLCLQHKNDIEHETLKASHRIQQFMTIQDMTALKEDFIQRLQADLGSQGVDFSRFTSKTHQKIQVANQDSAIIEAQRQAELKAQAEIEKARLQAELEEKAREEAEIKARAEALERAKLQAELEEERRKVAEAEERAKAEAIRQAELKAQAEEEAKRKAGKHTSLRPNQNDMALQCPKCGKEYPSHYTVCLKDGSKLVSIHKNFSI